MFEAITRIVEPMGRPMPSNLREGWAVAGPTGAPVRLVAAGARTAATRLIGSRAARGQAHRPPPLRTFTQASVVPPDPTLSAAVVPSTGLAGPIETIGGGG